MKNGNHRMDLDDRTILNQTKSLIKSELDKKGKSVCKTWAGDTVVNELCEYFKNNGYSVNLEKGDDKGKWSIIIIKTI